ncbi:hypothetical protein C5S53_17425 [Methanophagales archaeon]|nr:hypothetical protein C5S53_17425 [Methanophagales archaeon]
MVCILITTRTVQRIFEDAIKKVGIDKEGCSCSLARKG